MNRLSTAIILALFIPLFSCSQTDPNQEVDEGKVENNTYSSEEIGWTITLPENWEIISREQKKAYEEEGLDAMEEVVEGEIDVSGLKNLIGFQKNPFNIFQSTSQPFELEYEGEWEANNALLKELLYTTYTQQGIRVDSSATHIQEINGLDFQYYEFTLYSPAGEVILNQIMYSRLINGLDFGVNINYNNESDKGVMLDAWLNSKFSG